MILNDILARSGIIPTCLVRYDAAICCPVVPARLTTLTEVAVDGGVAATAGGLATVVSLAIGLGKTCTVLEIVGSIAVVVWLIG